MKQKKGEPGYLDHQLKVEIIKTLISFALVLAILALGIIQTGTRLNLLTVVAILGALPACKLLVGVITRFPYRSIPSETAEEIRKNTEYLTVAYDMIITSTEKIMPVDCIVISGHTVCGYTRSQKVDCAYLGKHIKNILSQNGYDKMTVKILQKYSQFLSRAEGMNAIAEIDQADDARMEDAVRHLILNISM